MSNRDKKTKDLKIIAEVAQGFEGNLKQSKLLVNAAANSGADIVKFQLVYADELATKDYKIYSFYKSLEMSDKDWKDLSTYTKKMGISLCFEIFGTKSLNLAKSLKLNIVKIHGTDVTNINLLESLSKSKIPNVILGLGGAHLNEVKNAVATLYNKNLILLLGFQDYPTKTQDKQIERFC